MNWLCLRKQAPLNIHCSPSQQEPRASEPLAIFLEQKSLKSTQEEPALTSNAK